MHTRSPHTHIHAHIHAHTHTHTRIHAHIHAHTHTHTHTQDVSALHQRFMDEVFHRLDGLMEPSTGSSKTGSGSRKAVPMYVCQLVCSSES